MRRLLPALAAALLLASTAPITSAEAPPDASGDPPPSCVVELGQARCGAGAPSGDAAPALSGEPDAAFPEVDAGTTKTGYRAFVAWRTDEPAWSVLDFRYSTPDGWSPWFQASEATPREKHVYVLRNLPQGETLQVRPAYAPADGDRLDPRRVQGPVRELELVNAYTDHDASADAYTVDMIVVADESPPVARAEIRRGVDRFATLLHDGTDGGVRPGEVLLLFGDTESYHAGRYGCRTTPQATPVCSSVPDAVITFDESPQAAGSTRLGAIQDPGRALRLNNQHYLLGQPPHLRNTIAGTLVHEFGHYGFWMPDQYTGAGCGGAKSRYDISIMDRSYAATEFDGPNAPCPNKDGYKTSWTALRNHYPQVPARPDGPDVGPSGPGAAYDLSTYTFGPGQALVDEPVVVRVTRGAHCARPACAAASATGPASGRLAASGTGAAYGTVAVTGTGTATGPFAAGAGECRPSADASARPCQAVRPHGSARGENLAVAGDGDASCRATPCVALALGGAASGSVAAATGDAAGLAAVSTGGHAAGLAAASGTGDADAPVAASGTGEADGALAASGAGPASGVVAASGTGPASGAVAASGTGEADGILVGASVTGPASGRYAVSGCELASSVAADPACTGGPRLPLP